MRYFAAPVVSVLVVLGLAVGVVIGGEVGRWQSSLDGGPVSVPGELPLPGPVRDLLVAAGFDRYVGRLQEVNWHVGLFNEMRGIEIGGQARHEDGRRVADIVFGDVAVWTDEAAIELGRRLTHESAHFECAERHGGQAFTSDGCEAFAQAREAEFAAAAALDAGRRRGTIPNAFSVPIEANP